MNIRYLLVFVFGVLLAMAFLLGLSTPEGFGANQSFDGFFSGKASQPSRIELSANIEATAPITVHLPAVLKQFDPVTFTHGVASGDIMTDGVVLWTRINREARLTAQVATDSGFSNVVYEIFSSATKVMVVPVSAVSPTTLTLSSGIPSWYSC